MSDQALPPIIVFEDAKCARLYPLTYARAACELRCGHVTLLERMQRLLPRPIAGLIVRDGLADVVRRRTNLPVNAGLSTKNGVILVNARWLMISSDSVLPAWDEPFADSAGIVSDAIVWVHLSAATAAQVDLSKVAEARTLEVLLPRLNRRTAPATLIDRPWDLLTHARQAIIDDFKHLGPADHASAQRAGVHILTPENVHLARDVKLSPGVVIDATHGPVIIGEHTEIRPNAVITGPVAIGANCLIRTLADIREDNCFGPGTRVGGEIIGSIFLGNANKQHHGFLGQSIIGEWANLGAGTTTSNLKNTYGQIKMALTGEEENTGKQFLGAIIADHAKLGIGTYLSTGSVVGFASHVTVARPPKFVPSFAWAVKDGVIERIDFEKVESIASLVMSRRGAEFAAMDHELFVRIAGDFALAEKHDWPS